MENSFSEFCVCVSVSLESFSVNIIVIKSVMKDVDLNKGNTSNSKSGFVRRFYVMETKINLRFSILCFSCICRCSWFCKYWNIKISRSFSCFCPYVYLILDFSMYILQELINNFRRSFHCPYNSSERSVKLVLDCGNVKDQHRSRIVRDLCRSKKFTRYLWTSDCSSQSYPRGQRTLHYYF